MQAFQVEEEVVVEVVVKEANCSFEGGAAAGPHTSDSPLVRLTATVQF